MKYIQLKAKKSKRPVLVLLVPTVILLCTCSCMGKKLSTRQEQQADTLWVKNTERVEERWRVDTVFVQLPPQEKERMLRQDSSYLENDFAQSEAKLLSSGELFHSLKTKPQKHPVQVQLMDSLVWQNKQSYRSKAHVEQLESKSRISPWYANIYSLIPLAIVLLVLFYKLKQRKICD